MSTVTGMRELKSTSKKEFAELFWNAALKVYDKYRGEFLSEQLALKEIGMELGIDMDAKEDAYFMMW